MIRPDGTVLGPFDAGKSMNGAWGISVDGNDNIWGSNSMSQSITQLCGVRTETCPSGVATGESISLQNGYIGGLQTITGIALDPAGNAWVATHEGRLDWTSCSKMIDFISIDDARQRIRK
ncbi:hypothetical protein AB9F26_21265 [Falsihalocynthiibacter sp. BN13B15]|uniref:hypothetical protein n=1 Tax=Falsihalocynthiibacter sp. BN13B15 TaxID=3240871 RepID=UPI00350F4DD6